MIVKRSKTNINANRAQVDFTNNQMATQKKITKPSDNPIIAIRALRLRSTLSTVTQYYENNIPDTESWMDVTETALKNMKDLITNAYEQVVYGSTDSLNNDNRQTILKELQELQAQVYYEGNADYAGRTVFTGYKTNQTLSFMDSAEASKASYNITEHYSYKQVDKKSYYSGSFQDTSNDTILSEDNPPELFEEVELNRLRLAYDKISANKDNSLTLSYTDSEKNQINTEFSSDGSISVQGIKLMLDDQGYFDDTQINVYNDGYYAYFDVNEDAYKIYRIDQMEIDPDEEDLNNAFEPKPGEENNYVGVVKIATRENADGDEESYLTFQTNADSAPISYRVAEHTSDLKDSGYEIGEDEIVFDAENGELLFHDNIAQTLDKNKTSFTMNYEKKGFDLGELRPENYFNCTKHTEDKGDIVFNNYDENWNWNTQAIYYNIAGGQQMQINTEARDVFDSNIRRDMDDLIEVVQFAINAQNTVDEIKKKIESGEYGDEEVASMNKWLDAAEKQLDYASQNMHDTYSAYITKFQGYLGTVNLEITDIGGRGERVALTKNRMSVQQSTFKELKSSNEDMELSDLVINYSAASVAYQSALQSAAKIGQMTLLNYL